MPPIKTYNLQPKPVFSPMDPTYHKNLFPSVNPPTPRKDSHNYPKVSPLLYLSSPSPHSTLNHLIKKKISNLSNPGSIMKNPNLPLTTSPPHPTSDLLLTYLPKNSLNLTPIVSLPSPFNRFLVKINLTSPSTDSLPKPNVDSMSAFDTFMNRLQKL